MVFPYFFQQCISIYNLIGKHGKHRTEDVLLLCVAWHKSGTFFVTGDYGYEDIKSLLQYWDEEGNLLTSNATSIGEYRNLSWDATGDRLASASGALRIWDKQGILIAEGKSDAYLWGVSWEPSGKRIVTTSAVQEITLWNAKAKFLKSIN